MSVSTVQEFEPEHPPEVVLHRLILHQESTDPQELEAIMRFEAALQIHRRRYSFIIADFYIRQGIDPTEEEILFVYDQLGGDELFREQYERNP